jgi:hypothetical protein
MNICKWYAVVGVNKLIYTQQLHRICVISSICIMGLWCFYSPMCPLMCFDCLTKD